MSVQQLIMARIERWLLPVFAMTTIIAVIVWIALALLVTGRQRLTPGAMLLIAGFAGTALIVVLAACVTVVILQTAAFDSRLLLLAEIRSALRHLGAHDVSADKEKQ